MFGTVSTTMDSVVSQITATQAAVVVVMAGIIIRWAAQKKRNLPPCPPAMPLVGHALELKETSLRKKTMEWMEKYGPVVRLYLGLQPWVVIGSIETMTEAYTQRGSDFANKPHVTSLYKVSEGGKNIAFAPFSEALKYRRKIAMLALRQYLTGSQHTDRVHAVVKEAVANMEANKGPFDPHPYFSHIIFNILHGICFGYTLRMDDPKYQELLSCFDRVSGNISGFWEDFFPLLQYFPTKRFRDNMTDAQQFKDYVINHILERRAIFNENNVETLVDSILLAQKQVDEGDSDVMKAEFDDVHLYCMLRDVFFAGIDTSRNTLDWIFLTVTANQDAQKKIQDELDTVLGGDAPGRDRRLSLVYTEATIMEVMRLYPVVPVGLPHETLRDTQVGGYDVPAKTQIIVNQSAILRDPKHWENPDAFKPERFIEEDGMKLKPRPKSWIPFSIGPRNCIGEFLAKQNLLYTVAGVLQKLHFDFAPGTQPDFTPVEKWIGLNCKQYKVVVTSRE